ncbi:MAG TPA: septal ring lytic transglycosylase RlpA family protein [Accumulibacter sp.]|nr:septal ring lytic transglycosylase RlpA family protein [Accumulibacter sp.]
MTAKKWLALAGLVGGIGVATAQSAPQIGMAADWPNSPPVISGRASFYGERFAGRKTASGERFDHQLISAASNRFPLGTVVAVRRVLSARCVVVRINDRMGHRTRVIDLSREAAVQLGMIDAGVTDVEVVPVPKTLRGHENACKLAFMPSVHLHAGVASGDRSEIKSD